MKPARFAYYRASTVASAVELLAEFGDDAKVIAGGQSLTAMMAFRLARPEHLIDIARITGLSDIRREGDCLRIGALATHRAIERADLGEDFKVLSRAMRWVGHLPIRTRGTVGGSLAHADATAEWCSLARLLDADIVAQGPAGQRRIPASDFFIAPYTTALDPAEIIVEVVFPRPAPRAALTEYADRQGDFAIVSAAVDLDGSPQHPGVPRVVLGGVAGTPLSVEVYGSCWKPNSASRFADLAEAVAAGIDLRDDGGFSVHYRRGLVRTLVERACEEAAA
ncbi:FAD binding domain-containing protein [Mycolicibacterium parafortuitum]|uniref:Molybdopterin dehydrogenase, FAD-binding protein [Saccharopolyspora erythraea NRRL 2338] n=1 Tax=Mycolicibacterium parafortuitum TaxID=39692 RepID=A0A375YLX0_MYCPF|nr:FAD binding domain-containing protein [Mycolicibacterium parafortuitum]ORB30000.1 molybdopterin dehydrogenase [Mycolicibacterium parafortuitum]SRX82102.1 molybdopterin dehydrogenase, FAD-binding protein [Saccharopolyspora erythraea NRRL 2338] [Mycolicibacterium parafortuitum]